jgi:class 3 adenylate cyclase
MGSGEDVVAVAGAACLTSMLGDPVPTIALDAVASFCRLTIFDQRGAGRSDPLADGVPLPLEARMADLVAVVDAASAEQPWLLAFHDGGPVALMAATTYPERFAGLILINTAPRLAYADDFPGGFSADAEAWLVEKTRETWGTGASAVMWVPSLASSAAGIERWAVLEQAACSPSQAVAQTRQAFATDARHLLPLVSIPSLIVQARFDPSLPPNNGRYLADHIPHAELVELPSTDHMPFVTDVDAYADAVRSFILRTRGPTPDSERRLATVVFTDIVDSTGHASRLGDSGWASLLDAHDGVARRIADARRGRIVKSTGDGLLVTFDGPANSIGFANEFLDQVAELGLVVRVGIHTGEIQRRGDDVAGISVHAAARIADAAPPGETLVSRTVVDLVAGSGFAFEPKGTHTLKGLDRDWELFSIARPDQPVSTGGRI